MAWGRQKGPVALTDVTERTFRDDGIESRKTHKTMTGLISEPPSVFKIVDKNPEEMSYKELESYIDEAQAERT